MKQYDDWQNDQHIFKEEWQGETDGDEIAKGTT
jgi:hypothetical protein